MANLEKVQQIYAAFGKGDIPAILNQLSEDVEWEYAISMSDVPWLKTRHGRMEVSKFFDACLLLSGTIFSPRHFWRVATWWLHSLMLI